MIDKIVIKPSSYFTVDKGADEKSSIVVSTRF